MGFTGAILQSDISYSTLLKSLLLILGIYLLFTYILYFTAAVKIKRLGGFAPKIRSWAPFSLDVLISALKSHLRHDTYNAWVKGFMSWGHPENPYTFEASLGRQRIILTADVANIKAVLATQFQDFGKGEQFSKDWHSFLGDSIFTTDGQKWHDSRQLIRPQFIKERLSDIETFESHCQILIPMLAGIEDGETVDVSDLFFKYTLDTATEFLLGKSVDSLHGDSTGFASAFNHAQHIQSIIAMTGPMNWAVPRTQLARDVKLIDSLCNQFIDATLALSTDELAKATQGESRYTFLHALAGYTKDRTVLRDQLVAILLAGRDTTACTLSWLFYELSRQPKIVAKLRQEILDVLGTTKKPCYQDLKSLKYLQYCLNETLRLYPIVPFNIRVALKDTRLPRGGGSDGSQKIGVLKNTMIVYSTLVMQRREDLYPPRASGFPPVDQFVPERWTKWSPQPWTYIPFNGGPRLCVGQQFALTEMAYTVTRILQNFEQIENRMPAPPKWKTDIVLQAAEGVQVAFYKAKVH